MTSTRTFDAGRKAQGFTSQAHLDAFFTHYDHATACPVCSKVAGAVPVDDGMQPVMGQCATGKALTAAFFTF